MARIIIKLKEKDGYEEFIELPNGQKRRFMDLPFPTGIDEVSILYFKLLKKISKIYQYRIFEAFLSRVGLT